MTNDMPDTPEQLFQLEARGDVLIVVVAAERLTAMDASDAFDEALGQLLQSQPARNWVIDFQNVTFMVTPAINTLVNVAKQIRTRNGALALTGLNENIAQVFSLMRLDEVFCIHPDPEAAIAALSKPSP